MTYSPSPALPSGTTISPASCGTIAPSASCALTIFPGSTPSAAPGNTSPTPITLSISGTNTNTLTPTLNILTYGSVYQGGFLYSVDDTTANTGSIGGKVASLTDQAAPYIGSGPQGTSIIWSSNGAGAISSDVDYTTILGIDETSTISIPSPTSPPYQQEHLLTQHAMAVRTALVIRAIFCPTIILIEPAGKRAHSPELLCCRSLCGYY